MKKTYNINISGCGFVIDDDAYDMLDSYLKTLGKVCERANQRETAGDIEQRIAEIFSERFSGPTPRIITLEDVQEVIGRMGAPEEIIDVEEVNERRSGPVLPPYCGTRQQPQQQKIQKRLYRDIDHKVLGGVCSGLAWYLGIDVVWVRILMVGLAFVSGSTMALIYIVLWAVIPPAKSPYEKMQMMGVNASMANVGRFVTGGYSGYQPGHPSGGNAAYCAAGTSPVRDGNAAARVVVMILQVIGLLVVGSLLVALSLTFVGCMVAEFVAPWSWDLVEAKLIMGCVMGGSLVVGVPLFLAFRGLLGGLLDRKFKRLSPLQWTFIAIPWLLGVGACITCGILL